MRLESSLLPIKVIIRNDNVKGTAVPVSSP